MRQGRVLLSQTEATNFGMDAGNDHRRLDECLLGAVATAGEYDVGETIRAV
jgi:hypothetical protein